VGDAEFGVDRNLDISRGERRGMRGDKACEQEDGSETESACHDKLLYGLDRGYGVEFLWRALIRVRHRIQPGAPYYPNRPIANLIQINR
jgi:hypothetical protein